MNEQDDTLRNGLGIGAVVLGALGLGWIITRKIQKARDNRESRRALDRQNPASYARRLRMALQNDNWAGWGTDEEAIRRVLVEMPDFAFWEAVQSSYEKQYQSILSNDLESDLSSTEYLEMLAIIERLRWKHSGEITDKDIRNWGERLHAAFRAPCTIPLFPCTDEEAAYQVLREIPSRRAFIAVAQYYLDQFGISLEAEAQSEFDSQELQTWNNLKPQN